jgi:hypothetical protein
MIDHGPVQKMLERYECRNNDERRDALKEIVQEITLVALGRAGFFSHAAFYGGTALRIFHGLERFSEDLDFSLTEPDPAFDLGIYLPAVRDELGSFGFDMEVTQKPKSADSAVQSAFIKGGTLIHLIKIAAVEPPVPGVPKNEQLKIKFEVDTDPPAGAGFEVKYRLSPIPYSVRLYDPPSLFAGKLHALLCRNWKQRVKGRDFFDYVWYLSQNVPVNVGHLEARMRQSGHWSGPKSLDRESLLALLDGRFSAVDFARAKADVIPFIRDSRSVELWSRDFFVAVSRENLKCQAVSASL